MNLTESSSAATPDLIAQAIPGMAFWHLDLAKDHVYWSPALKSLYGVDEAPATLADYLSMIHSENRARAAELVADWLARHQSFEHVFTLSRPDGERRNIRETGSVQRDREGHALSV